MENEIVDRTVDPLAEACGIKDAAIRTGLPAAWIRRHVRENNLPSTKVGRTVMVSPRVLLQKVDEWVATGEEPPTVKRWKGVDLNPAKFADIFDDEPF